MRPVCRSEARRTMKRAITRTQAVAHVHGYRRIRSDWPWFVIVFGAYAVMIAMACGWRP